MYFSEIFDDRWWMVVARYFINLGFVLIVCYFFYYRKNKGKPEYLFAYLSFSTIIFIICIMLSVIPVELGFALGLFAVFSIIRFRSIQVSPRELSYLLLSLGFAILNALSGIDYPIIRLIVTNILILLTVGVFEILLFRTGKVIKTITYDRLDLLKNDKQDLLEKDLFFRFEITNIQSVQVGDIDVAKNKVKLKVTFIDKSGKNFTEF